MKLTLPQQNRELRVDKTENGDLKLKVAEHEIAFTESLQIIDSTLEQADDLFRVVDNINGVRQALENFGVSDAVISITDLDGDICRLLEVDEPPQITDDNREEVQTAITEGLSKQVKNAFSKIIEWLRNLARTITRFFSRGFDFADTLTKQCIDESKRLRKIKEADPEFRKTELELPVIKDADGKSMISFLTVQEKIKEAAEELSKNLLPETKSNMDETAKLFREFDSSEDKLGESLQALGEKYGELTEKYGPYNFSIEKNNVVKRTAEQVGLTDVDSLVEVLEESAEALKSVSDMKGDLDEISKLLESLEDELEEILKKQSEEEVLTEEQINKIMEIVKEVKSPIVNLRQLVTISTTVAKKSLTVAHQVQQAENK